MSRYNTQVLSNIRMLCRMQNIDEKVLYERAKLILSIYREVCWSTIDRANDVCDTLICTYGDSLDGALIYLENFAPDEARERFEERIRSLFETKWIIELVDMAILHRRLYDGGNEKTHEYVCSGNGQDTWSWKNGVILAH